MLRTRLALATPVVVTTLPEKPSKKLGEEILHDDPPLELWPEETLLRVKMAESPPVVRRSGRAVGSKSG
jgi:hypothetical protein